MNLENFDEPAGPPGVPSVRWELYQRDTGVQPVRRARELRDPPSRDAQRTVHGLEARVTLNGCLTAVLNPVVLLAALAFLAIGCGPSEPSYPYLATVPHVDLQRYAGRWYEVARIPKTYEQGCVGTATEYTPVAPDMVRVVQWCRVGSLDGPERHVDGTARVLDVETNAKLKVWFNFYRTSDHWILDLDPDYRRALVGTPDRQSLWVLSRTPSMEPAALQRLLGVARDRGFDVSRVERTVQPDP